MPSPASLSRIGLYGGSFDPVHNGHLLVAQTAIEELSLERLFLIPAAQSPFKPEQSPIDASERVRLLRLGFAGWTKCEIDLQEIGRGGISYTIDTVRDYGIRFPEADLYCLIGTDHLPLLPKWRDANALAKLTDFVVVPRPGEPTATLQRQFRIHALRGFPFALSSSQIRQRVREGLKIDHLAPRAVAEHIRNNGLYL